MVRVDEVAGGIYRIAHYAPGAPITYNQFLIDQPPLGGPR